MFQPFRALRSLLPVVLAVPFAGLPGAPAEPADPGARVERLAEGVYVILHRDATRDWPSGATDWPHGNTGVIIGDDGVLVVDATFLPARARADIALIRRLTTKPVRYLVNTHWHGDHTHGNGVYQDSFPGLAIVGARENRRFIATNQERFPNVYTPDSSASRLELRRLEGLRRAGRDSTGRAWTAGELARLDSFIVERRTQLAELALVRVVPPNLLFDDDLTLYLGRRRVDFRNWGRANSPDDVTIYLPDERILFAGDILVRPVPYSFGAYPLPWIGVLRGLEALPVAAVVPGHGEVERDHGYTRQVRRLLETVTAQADSLMKSGIPFARARPLFDLRALRAEFVRPGDATAAAYWEASVEGEMLERAWLCAAGSKC